MKTRDLLSLSTRMFKTRPMRTFLTVLGVGVGIGTVLFLVSLGYGLQHVILSRISTADSLLTLDVSGGPSEELALTTQSVRTIQMLPEVAEISRLKNFAAQMKLNDLATNGQVSAVDYSFLRLKGVTVMHGNVYTESATGAALISSAGAKLFNMEPADIVGKTVDIALSVPDAEDPSSVNAVDLGPSFTITGVVEDENLSYVIIPLDSLDGKVEVDRFDQLKVKVTANELMEATRTRLIERGFVVSALSDIIEQANKVFRVVQIVLALFGFVALIVSAIGMFNTMTITLLERTNEIGIMRAIGITRKDIRMLFLVESMLMGFLGGLGGVIIGVAAGSIANIFVNLLAVRFGGTAIDLFYVPGWFVAVIIGFSTCIGFVTGIYPSRRASHLNPLDALRYK